MSNRFAFASPEAERFQSAFDRAVDPMIVVDDDRRVLRVNAAACALFGISADVAPGQTLDGLFGDDGAGLTAAWTQLLALGEARREHRITSARTGLRFVECSFRARAQGEGRHLCVVRDITDRRLIEDRLIESEKIDSVGRLAGGVAHDFNNLLTAILGYTELLLRDHSADDDPDRRDLREIEKAALRAAALTQQLLAYSRKQVLRPQDVDLNRVVADLKAMMGRLIREDITLTCDLAPGAALVKIDPKQLEQVILNLVLNARDALPGGGLIRLEVAIVPGSEVDVPFEHALTAANYVRLRVVDNGVGIAPEMRPYVFEPFFTTKDVGKGTGLGLASVYGIVRQSHGFIDVESHPGRGTTFTMHFPAVVAAADGAKDTVSAAARHGVQQTILLVEDEDAVRLIVGTVLRRQGYRVLDSAHPHTAREIFDQQPDAIDLLLTDVVMPGMNGPALAQRLVAINPRLCVLFISGYSDLTLPVASGNPHVGFLGKPFPATALIAKVRDVLAHSRQRPAVRGHE
jgi:PAS domain S-box-containing protein